MSAVVISGNTSGSITLDAPAVAGSTTYTLAAVSGTISPLVSGTAQASTSGTSIDFTDIPSWAKRITVMFDGVSTNGASNVQVQLGDSGGIETSGYLGESSFTGGGTSKASSTTGMVISLGGIASSRTGLMTFYNFNGNIWTQGHTISDYGIGSAVGAGSKTLSAILDRIRITTVNGTDTFDAGSINIMYE